MFNRRSILLCVNFEVFLCMALKSNSQAFSSGDKVGLKLNFEFAHCRNGIFPGMKSAKFAVNCVKALQ